jgi:hypothetical protein
MPTPEWALTMDRRNLPSDVEALFTRQPPIKDVIEFALGDLGTYFVSYRDHDDQILCRKSPLSSYPHISIVQISYPTNLLISYCNCCVIFSFFLM